MIVICNDKQEIVNKAADKFVEIARAAISKHGIFTVALSGGSTPAELYSMLPTYLSHSQIDINKIHLFWGDERSVPPDHQESNYRMAKETLIRELSLPDNHIHRIKAENGKDAARAYEKEISDFFKLKNGEMPKFNLILLGLGEDGHTASLFPGCLPVKEDKRLVSAVFIEQLQALRFTLTPEVINSAFTIVFLVSGRKKARVFYEVINGEYNPDRFPAQIVRSAKAEEVIWFIDKGVSQYFS